MLDTSLSHFSEAQKTKLFSQSLPKHVALIPDGNRRWAKQRSLSSLEGHQAGITALSRLIEGCLELSIPYLTVYGFSTENRKRPPEETLPMLMLIAGYLLEEAPKMVQSGIRLRAIGDLSALPPFLQETLKKICDETAPGNRLHLTLALHYGGRDELCRACAKLLQSGVIAGPVSEELFASYLDTKDLPDPDLLIRTSGEMRVSNFLLWQIAYAELVVSEAFWPDFSPNHFMEALVLYQARERRGGV